MRPQLNAQSASVSHTNGETGTGGQGTGTDENNTNQEDMGPFSDDKWSASDGSDNIAVEYGEDPIEKSKFKYGRQPQRLIPDRAKIEEMREQAYNNFMLSPWVVPEEEKKDGPTSPNE